MAGAIAAGTHWRPRRSGTQNVLRTHHSPNTCRRSPFHRHPSNTAVRFRSGSGPPCSREQRRPRCQQETPSCVTLVAAMARASRGRLAVGARAKVQKNHKRLLFTFHLPQIGTGHLELLPVTGAGSWMPGAVRVASAGRLDLKLLAINRLILLLQNRDTNRALILVGGQTAAILATES